MSVRMTAVCMLEEIEKGGAYSTILLNKWIQKNHMDDRDRGLLTEIVYGTLQRKLTLDYWIDAVVTLKKPMDSWVRNVLRISIYQLQFLERIPAHAILHEAVEISKKKGHAGIGKFVNGVLRGIQRNGVASFDELTPIEARWSVEYSMPEWMVRYLIQQNGQEETKQLLQSLLKPPHVSLRISDIDKKEEILTQLEQEGITVVDSQVSPVGLRVVEGSIFQTHVFQEGLLTVQDESSMLVVPTANVMPHEQVLDACAAPGGKTTHVAQFLDSTKGGRVYALDLHDHKVNLILENAKRLHVDHRVEAVQLDARKAIEYFKEKRFDCAIVDAPCSGLGLMRRKPDIKYTKKERDFHQLHSIQMDILSSVACLLKSGGRLIYSTCTLSTEENEHTIHSFLKKFSEFEIEPLTEYNNLEKSITEDGALRLLPHHYETDGFFICRLIKK